MPATDGPAAARELAGPPSQLAGTARRGRRLLINGRGRQWRPRRRQAAAHTQDAWRAPNLHATHMAGARARPAHDTNEAHPINAPREPAIAHRALAGRRTDDIFFHLPPSQIEVGEPIAKTHCCRRRPIQFAHGPVFNFERLALANQLPESILDSRSPARWRATPRLIRSWHATCELIERAPLIASASARLE